MLFINKLNKLFKLKNKNFKMDNTAPVLASFEMKHLYIVLAIFIIVILIIYFINFVYNFSYDTKLQTIKKEYQNNLIQTLKTIDAYECVDLYGNKYLSEFYIASSANSFLIGKQTYDYVSMDMIKNCLIMGARYIELNILADSIGLNPTPIVTTGIAEGSWQTSVNNLNFENVCETISNFAFSKDIKTNQLPLFLYLKLKVTDKPNVIRLITKILKNYFPSKSEKDLKSGNRLDHNIDPANSKMCTLFNQVIIWSDAVSSMDNYNENQKKIINEYNTTINKFSPQRLHYSELGKQTVLDISKSQTPEDKRRKADELTEKNRNQLTIVYPNKENENDSTSYNYDPTEAWSYGCQFVALNYQTNDDNRTIYFEKFKTDSISLKPSVLQRKVENVQIDSLDKRVPTEQNKTDKNRKQLAYIYTEAPVYFRPYNSPTKIIAIEDKSLVIKELDDKNLSINDGFIIQPNLNDPKDGFKIVFESLKHPNHYISYDGRGFNLFDWRIKKFEADKNAFVKSALFIPKKSFVETRGNMDTQISQNEKDNLISFYLNGVEKEIMIYHTPSNSVISKADDPQNFDLSTSASFFMYKLPVIKSYNIRQSDNLYLEVINGMVAKKNKDYNNNGIFEFISEDQLNLHLESSPADKFIHIRDYNNNYWGFDNGSIRSVYKDPGYNTRFFTKKVPNTPFTKIMYGGGKKFPLIVTPDGILKYSTANEMEDRETLFIITISYKIKKT